jgi:hypothetical protein
VTPSGRPPAIRVGLAEIVRAGRGLAKRDVRFLEIGGEALLAPVVLTAEALVGPGVARAFLYSHSIVAGGLEEMS